jgi:hypothetical protein
LVAQNGEGAKAVNSRSKTGRAAKSIFGVVVGTLKKAELEDKKRNATEAVSFFCRFFLVR